MRNIIGFMSRLAMVGLLGQLDGAAVDLFVSSADAGQVLRFDGTTGAPLGTFASVSGSLAFGPGGDLFVSSGDKVLRFNGKTGAPRGTFAFISGAGPLAFGPGGDLFVANSSGVLRFNGSTGTQMGTFVSSVFQISDLTFGPTGDLFIVNGDQLLRFNGMTGAPMGSFAPIFSGRSLAFGPSGDLFVSANVTLAIGGSFIVIYRLDGVTGAQLEVFSVRGLGTDDLAFGPSGDLFVASTFSDRVLRLNGATGESLGTFVSVQRPASLAFGPSQTTPPPSSVPLPGTLLLILCGLGGLGLMAPKLRTT